MRYVAKSLKEFAELRKDYIGFNEIEDIIEEKFIPNNKVVVDRSNIDIGILYVYSLDGKLLWSIMDNAGMSLQDDNFVYETKLIKKGDLNFFSREVFFNFLSYFSEEVSM